VPLRAVLFDLDGTLLDNDMDVFLTHFLRRFAPHVAHRVPPDTFVKAWMHALHFVLRNTDFTLTNQQVFDLNFYPQVGALRDELLPAIEAFYATSHRSLRSLAHARPGARETVLAMQDAGVTTVVATNPIFPLVAVEQRLEWAGVADLPFALVTHSENMHATKPSLIYYEEILNQIDCEPEDCLMIGDDFVNDIQPANRLRMKTYWVNVSTTTPPNFDPRARGELHQFYAWLVAAGLLPDPS
jgi:HAD superfamily hydrolase (TIGR01549 family)